MVSVCHVHDSCSKDSVNIIASSSDEEVDLFAIMSFIQSNLIHFNLGCEERNMTVYGTHWWAGEEEHDCVWDSLVGWGRGT